MSRYAAWWALVVLSSSAGCAVRETPFDGGGGGGTSDAPLDRPDAPIVLPDGEVPVCRAVDVLFVIDDSASMADQQAALIASFGGFVDGMRARLSSGLRFHVGVVSSDAYGRNEPGCTAIGDLVTQTGGLSSSMTTCGPFSTGGRYMDDLDPDLDAHFACAAQLGVVGSDDERVARAVLSAIDPTRPCNAGFLRPDALLVIVIITDEDDVADGCDPGTGTCLSYGSGGTPDDWLAELATIRDPSSVVVLSLLGERADNPCGAVVASRLIGFTNRFPHSRHGDVCASSYDEFFTESLPVVATACEELF